MRISRVESFVSWLLDNDNFIWFPTLFLAIIEWSSTFKSLSDFYYYWKPFKLQMMLSHTLHCRI